MASLKQLRQRIRSVQGTKQIMRAMQLVSAAKLKRAQLRLGQAHAVMTFLDGLLQRVLAAVPTLQHPLCRPQAEVPGALVVLTSDTGLCGAYNTNLIQLAEAELRRDTRTPTQVIFIGKRAHRYFTTRGVSPLESYLDLAGRPQIDRIDAIGRALMERFLLGALGEVKLLYATCVSTSVCRPVVRPWLPIRLAGSDPKDSGSASPAGSLDYLFEPSPQRVFEDLLPRWAMATFRLVMLESFASEHSARMIAMKNATDNAEELVDTLTLQRNKLRQAMITKDISEIVGTVEALK